MSEEETREEIEQIVNNSDEEIVKEEVVKEEVVKEEEEIKEEVKPKAKAKTRAKPKVKISKEPVEVLEKLKKKKSHLKNQSR